MISLNAYREFSIAYEVHKSLLLAVLFFGVINIFVSLRVSNSFIFLLQIDYVRAGENALELDDELSDTLIFLFLFI